MCPDSGRPWAFPVSGRECLIVDPSDPSPIPQANNLCHPAGVGWKRTSQSRRILLLGLSLGVPGHLNRGKPEWPGCLMQIPKRAALGIHHGSSEQSVCVTRRVSGETDIPFLGSSWLPRSKVPLERDLVCTVPKVAGRLIAFGVNQASAIHFPWIAIGVGSVSIVSKKPSSSA